MRQNMILFNRNLLGVEYKAKPPEIVQPLLQFSFLPLRLIFEKNILTGLYPEESLYFLI